mmetsp:Transcript_6393/g.13272  ORF Transcript_6393/g.13272 Transcript_6393/m.13272 type:complete len:249 (-) Transcript_6393:655-1401(-)
MKGARDGVRDLYLGGANALVAHEVVVVQTDLKEDVAVLVRNAGGVLQVEHDLLVVEIQLAPGRGFGSLCLASLGPGVRDLCLAKLELQVPVKRRVLALHPIRGDARKDEASLLDGLEGAGRGVGRVGLGRLDLGVRLWHRGGSLDLDLLLAPLARGVFLLLADWGRWCLNLHRDGLVGRSEISECVDPLDDVAELIRHAPHVGVVGRRQLIEGRPRLLGEYVKGRDEAGLARGGGREGGGRVLAIVGG